MIPGIRAVDADFSGYPAAQYGVVALERELFKVVRARGSSANGVQVMCGFGVRDSRFYERTVPIATGRWGSGVFAGELELKFGLQLIAAATARRQLVYHTFGDTELVCNDVRMMADS